MTSHDAAGRSTAIGLVAILLWSTTVGLIRSISEHFGPTGGAALLFSLAGVLVTLVLGLPRLRQFHPAYLYGGGALFIAYEICLALSIGFAQDRQQALELGMINYLWPSLTVLLAVLAGQQRGSRWLVPGLGLAFLGIVWVMKGDGDWHPAQFRDNLLANPLAYGLAFAAALLWAVYSVLTRRWGAGKSGVSVFLLATGVLLWGRYAMSDEPALQFSWVGAGPLLFLSASMAAAYSCWNHGVQKGNMTVLATASFFTPVLSALLGALWLRTQPAASFWQGVAMVVAGSIVCWLATRERRAKG